MKQLLLTLLASAVLLFAGVPPAEQSHAEEILTKNVKLFGLSGSWITISVRRVDEMKVPAVWGDVNCGDGGCKIEVLATEDYPPSVLDRGKFQNAVIQHEVMHVKLLQIGVPGEAQDGIIEALQPSLQKVN